MSAILQEGQIVENEFIVRSSFQIQVENPKKIISLGIYFIVIATLTGSLFFFGRRFANSLRRQGQKLEEQDHQLQAISVALKENQKNDRTGAKSGVSRPRK